MIELKELSERLKSKQEKIVIVSHRSPDGDSIGSSLGMMHFLKSIGHQVTVITPDPAPQFLSWMPDFDTIINFENHREKTEEAIESAEIIFCLDFNDLQRSASLEQDIRKNEKALLVNIDHHLHPKDFADFQWSDTKASSTCELVFQFAESVLEKEFESKEFAQCIYTGILTDTGSFRFSSTTEKTHLITSRLLAMGVEPDYIQSKVFDSYSVDRLKLLGFALNEKLLLYPEYKSAIIALTEKELQQFNFQRGDTEGLVNFPLSIQNINMSILITEKDGKVKMSFRSKGSFPVNEIASKYFSGGGHLNAAGGISSEDVEETVKKLEKIIPDYEEKLNF